MKTLMTSSLEAADAGPWNKPEQAQKLNPKSSGLPEDGKPSQTIPKPRPGSKSRALNVPNKALCTGLLLTLVVE